MSLRINGIESVPKDNYKKNERPTKFVIKGGETLTSIAKKCGMSVNDLILCAGLKNAKVNQGDKIILASDKVPEGRSIKALANKYKMTVEQFCKLNNIPKNYQPKNNEIFYVIIPKHSKLIQNREIPDVKEMLEDSRSEFREHVKRNLNRPEQMKETWGSLYTPQELASKIYQLSGEYYGAVGKPDFDALIEEINPKNASAVLNAYTKEESLIHTIAREINSDKEKRKAAIMHIYEALSEEKGFDTDKTKKNEFKKELNSQFEGIWLVDTKKLDQMIDQMLKYKIPKSNRTTKAQPAPGTQNGRPVTPRVKQPRPRAKYDSYKHAQIAANIQKSCINASATEYEKHFYSGWTDPKGVNQKSFIQQMKDKIMSDSTISSEQKQVLVNRMKNAKFNQYDIRRPMPNIGVNGETDNSIKLTQLKPIGKPNGKVIILNEGHGGYNGNSFDPGASSYIEKPKGSNVYSVLEEYEVVQPYSDDLALRLRKQGYEVVRFSGSVNAMRDDKFMEKLVYNYTNKYDENNVMFISFHADASASGQASGASVCYRPNSNDNTDENFANIINSKLNYQPQINAKTSPRSSENGNGLYVLNTTCSIPSVLLEVGYLNPSNNEKITSPSYRDQFVTATMEGINEYFANIQNKKHIPIQPSKPIEEKKKTDKAESVDNSQEISFAKVRNLEDVAKITGLSMDFVLRIKRIEDGLADNKFQNTVIKDRAGVPTIGIGHKILKGEDFSKGLTDAQVCQLFAKDLDKIRNQLYAKLGGKEYYDKLPTPLKEAVLDMVFNKGSGVLDKSEGLISCLKGAKYEAAINKLTFNKSIATGKEMSGLSKRRLFDLSLAFKMHNGKIPKSNLDTAQKVYNRGIELLRKEVKDKQRFLNILAGYNKEVKSYLGDNIKLING